MALNAAQVRVALTGHVYYIPTLPFAETTDLAVPTGAVELGYTTSDGVTFNFGREVEDITGWQSADPMRKLVLAEPRSASFTLQQMSRGTWTTTMGGTVTELKAAEVGPPAVPAIYRWEPDLAKIPEGALLVDFEDGEIDYRFGFRRAQNTAEVEFALVRNAAVNLPNQWTALATSDGKKSFFMDTNDPAFAPAP